jgi:peptidoglycan/LPS O-acetylase OafA/YrhL
MTSLPALLIVLTALSTAGLMSRLLGLKLPDAGRFIAIDGLRGYLACMVFVHHAAVWFAYSHGEGWRLPPSNLYIQFGQGSVVMFFMITGFLFVTKILDSDRQSMDWGRLFVGRFLRLVPLYLLMLVCLFVFVGVMSDWSLQQPLPKVASAMFTWLFFTVAGAPDINGVFATGLMVSMVTWSLVYEWLFYFSLPFCALLLGKRPPVRYLALGGLGLMAIVWSSENLRLPFAFLGGILAALMVRWPMFSRFAPGRMASAVIITCLSLLVWFFDSAHGPAPLLLLTVVFALIAGGNTLFGLLSHRWARAMGEGAYGIYLLHGLVLFGGFQLVVGQARASHWSLAEHWAAVAVMTGVLVAISLLTFQLIEQPAVRQTTRTAQWLRARLR